MARSWQCLHFCVAYKFENKPNQAFQYKFKAPWEMSICTEIDTALNYFQFISIKKLYKIGNVVNNAYFGKTP